MSDTTQRKVPLLPDPDTEFPLLWLGIARHLGIYRFDARDRQENLRRTKRVFQTFSSLGVSLLLKNDGQQPVTADDITEDLIVRHEGRVTGEEIRSTEQFEENLLNIIADHTGVPRVSYRQIHFPGLRLDRPHTVFQEIDDRYRSERRRVERYPDGRLLWCEESSEGTAEEEFVDTFDIPGVAIVNARPGQRAEESTAEEFERLWQLAIRDKCMWIIAPGQSAASDTYCPLDRKYGALCGMHADGAARMFPAIFPTA